MIKRGYGGGRERFREQRGQIKVLWQYHEQGRPSVIQRASVGVRSTIMKKFHERYCRQTLSESGRKATQTDWRIDEIAQSDLKAPPLSAARKGVLCASDLTQKAFTQSVHSAYLPSY